MSDSRCVNCGVNVSRMQRHSIESDEARSIIQQWTTLSEIQSDSVVCHACWLLIEEAMHSVSDSLLMQTVGHQNICVGCGHSLHRTRSHSLSDSSEQESSIKSIIEEWIAPRQLRASDKICHPCWQRSYRAIQRNLSQPSTSSASIRPRSPNVELRSSTSEEEPRPSLQEVPQPSLQEVPLVPPVINNTIILSEYGRAPDTQAHCFFPGCDQLERLSVPLSIRKRLFSEYNFYVPQSCRICTFHLRNNLWDQLMEAENVIHTFTAEQIYDFTDLLRNQSIIDFEGIQNMDEYLVHFWFGISKEQFRAILIETPPLANMARGSTALAAYLLKLRNGDSNDRISSLFRIPRSTLESLMGKARELLHVHFVPLHLGLNHITRQEIAQRNLLIPQGLFGGTETDRKPIIIADGTYIYGNKSSNYAYQKKTYSLHKYRNLVKPFLFVCCDGHIIDILGPYPATMSDAQIINNEFRQESQPLRQYFQDGDVFILDRGFRDSLPLLRQQCNYSVHVPSSLEQNESQLSTIEANRSRTVTICRWVVEVINGVFKQWFKIFRHEFNHRALPHLMTDFSVAAALINRFRAPITNRIDAAQILQIIQQKMYQNNTLSDYIIENNYNRRRADFININVDSENVTEFPVLQYDDLILIGCGTYQLRQARSYYGEHIRFNGRYMIQVCRDTSLDDMQTELSLPESSRLIRAKIQSRHVGRKVYYVYILFDTNLNGRAAVNQYYCNCTVGKRTVGCCSHTMTILWYLGWARYQASIEPPAQFLDTLLVDYDDDDDDSDN